jgi:hypothetical protein
MAFALWITVMAGLGGCILIASFSPDLLAAGPTGETAAVDLFQPTATPLAAPTPWLPGTPVGIATAYLNVRSGPGTAYPILDWLEPGHSFEITGVCANGGWWQIRYSGAADGYGWVSSVYVSARNTQTVPTLTSPPFPRQYPKLADRLGVYQGSKAPVTSGDWVSAEVGGWRGEYFANRDLAGAPALVRVDTQIDFDWGSGAPASGMPADDFSVRWTQDLDFSAATYRFYVYVDDGVRLWVDGALVIDQWHESVPTNYAVDLFLAEGGHHVRMEYYEQSGMAVAQLAWEALKTYPDWRGEYYDNPSLAGAPVLVRNDVTIDFYWPESPGPGVPPDDFSARWTRTLDIPAGIYIFSVVVDDGARLWVDDELIIDGWRPGPPEGYSAEIGLSDDPHTIRLEYFEFRYGAQLFLSYALKRDIPPGD